MADALDRDLAQLRDAIDFPATPDLVRGVGAALATRRRRPPRASLRRAIALAAAATLVLAAAVAAVSLAVPGLRITLVPELPFVAVESLGSRLALGERVDAAGIDAPMPRVLGPPDEVYLDRPTGVVSLVYGADPSLPGIGDSDIGLLVQVIPGALQREQIEKLVVEVGATVTAVDVRGADGFWIEGPPHLVRYLDRSGTPRAERTRLAGDTLAWARDGMLFRIESGLGLEATLDIAASIGP